MLVGSMDINNSLDIVRHFAARIQNGRQLLDITKSADRELSELCDEVHLHNAGKAPGPDGVVGEAVDVIACMLDLIFTVEPNTTDSEINAILLRKCEKWARRYKDSVEGDRSID